MDVDITELLRQHRAGDRAAFDRLLPHVYPQLQKIARQQLRRFADTALLQATELVQETYLQLVEECGVDWQDRGHFFAARRSAAATVSMSSWRRTVRPSKP